MAKPGFEKRIPLSVFDGVRDVVRPDAKESVFVSRGKVDFDGNERDVEDAICKRNYRRFIVHQLAVLFRTDIWTVFQRVVQ